MDKVFYAHSEEGEQPKKWQRLEEHLKNVAEMARGFAEDFEEQEWAYLAGLWDVLRNPRTHFRKCRISSAKTTVKTV